MPMNAVMWRNWKRVPSARNTKHQHTKQKWCRLIIKIVEIFFRITSYWFASQSRTWHEYSDKNNSNRKSKSQKLFCFFSSSRFAFIHSYPMLFIIRIEFRNVPKPRPPPPPSLSFSSWSAQTTQNYYYTMFSRIARLLRSSRHLIQNDIIHDALARSIGNSVCTDFHNYQLNAQLNRIQRNDGSATKQTRHQIIMTHV